MITTVKAGPFTVRGISVGGLYTALHVPELSSAFDVGLAPRSIAGVKRLFLSHGHVDHAGALATMLGIRALMSMPKRLQVFLPEELVDDVTRALAACSAMQRYELAIDAIPMRPGRELALGGKLWVRAFRTHHPVPALGYQFFHRVDKLRTEFAALPGAEIAVRRQAGEDLFDQVDRLELAYATDTLTDVFTDEPSLFSTRVLILECTFLDERKSLAASHAGFHTHLDDLLDLAERFENQHIVLMHFSQIYRPDEISALLDRRCPADLRARLIPFAPDSNEWPG
jgi:ribonuclease Z